MSVNKFGRLVSPPDERDKQFPIRAAMLQIRPILAPQPRATAYNDGPLLDQGPHPFCVGYAERGFLNTEPIMENPVKWPSGPTLYRGAQKYDEWPGDIYDGTSVRGGMKYMKAARLISACTWGQSVDDAISWMNGGYGTVVVGTNWYIEMSDVDGNGFMREPPATGTTPIGGHAWRWIWYDTSKQGILMRNSWGNGFGWPLPDGQLSGYAFLTVGLATRLLAEAGEVAAPTKVPLKAVVV